MKFSNFSICNRLFFLLAGIVPVIAIATPSVLADPGKIQQLEAIPRIKPEILHDAAIFHQNQKICGSRSQSECKKWLEKIRSVQKLRGIIIPLPQPDPSPELIRISPNQINP